MHASAAEKGMNMELKYFWMTPGEEPDINSLLGKMRLEMQALVDMGPRFD
jgi:hypothetical protein